MDVRKAVPGDLDAIMRVYGAAQEFMIRTGNPNQWRRSYPTRALLTADIAAFSARRRIFARRSAAISVWIPTRITA